MASQNEAMVRYTIDPKASQFTVQAFASGLISAVAHSPKIAIRGYTANVSFVPGTLADARLRVVIQSSTLQILDELRDNLNRVNVKGWWALHGITNGESFFSQV